MKKIKLPLEMDNGVQVRTLEELKENWSLEKILMHYLNGRLLSWLNDRYYSDIAEKVENIKHISDSKEIQKQLCEVFGMELDDVKVNVEEVSEKNKRIEILRKYTDDEAILKNISKVAFNQEELADLLDDGENVIYLFNGSFTVPVALHNKKYIGIGDVNVTIGSKNIVNLNEAGIEFKNVKLDERYKKIIEDSPEGLYKRGKEYDDNGDYVKALEFYDKAAKLNNKDALFRLGWFYSEGLGVEVDYEKSMRYYLLAADLGHSTAMNNIGAAYANGWGVNKDALKALEWYTKAYENGSTFSAKNIGGMYYYSEGVDKDYYKSFEWYQKSDDQSYSCYMLGWMYEFGQGTDVDNDKALEYYKLAAQKGYYNKSYIWDPTFRYTRLMYNRYNKQNEAIEFMQKYYDKEKLSQFVKTIREKIDELKFPYVFGSLFTMSCDFISDCTGESDARRKLSRRIQSQINEYWEAFVEDANSAKKRFINDIRELCEAIIILTSVAGISINNLSDEIVNVISNCVAEALNNVYVPNASTIIDDWYVDNEPYNSGSIFKPSYGYSFRYSNGSTEISDKIKKDFENYMEQMIIGIKDILISAINKI